MKNRLVLAAVVAALAPSLGAAQSSSPTYSFSGFGTLGAVRTDTDAAQYATSVVQPGGARRGWDAEVDSLIAGQVDVRFTPALSLVVQAVANKTAKDNFTPHVEWAFGRWAVTRDLTLRGGIMSVPVFMGSDSRLVGISYPWVRTPTALYSQVPITNFRGVDALYRVAAGNVTVTVQPYLGAAPTDVPSSGTVVKSKLDDMMGLNVAAEMGSWTVRAGYMRTDFTYSTDSTRQVFAGIRQVAGLVPGAGALAELEAVEKKTSFAGVGVGYDGGNLFFQSEYGQRRSDSFLADTDAWYASFGYRFGNVMPHLTISEAKVKSATSQRVLPTVGPLAALGAGVNSLLASQDVAQETVAAGVRWQFARNADFKLQWDRVKLPGGALGNFRGSRGFAGTVNVYSAAVDFVF
jgi:hypothetical protein